ncbi:hypothetical protein OCK74_26285 [Chitinophagaceae bacterium LB-8]|uniref:Uncharacterized protein n=1 Tax=Paraflavisolibacter caeni TaxID=2982496 RepID=A0A9X2Y052_9BACT|nr:hypothetical protein [Paraflavisolibacter caeni]MCU7552656.1 hypothetical protein [Paraflavisolibacter caeni]
MQSEILKVKFMPGHPLEIEAFPLQKDNTELSTQITFFNTIC